MKLDIRRFAPWELRGWWEKTSPRLLVVIDIFADRWRAPVYVSRHPRAIGREDGPEGTSQHNVDAWGEVRAIDLMPAGMDTEDAARRAVCIATEVGATGIGVYPHWSPRAGLHLDVRVDATPGLPALWGGVRRGKGQVLVSMEAALAEFA